MIVNNSSDITMPCGGLALEDPYIYGTSSGTVKPVTRGHLKKCPYMTGVPSSQVHFNVKVYFGSQKMQFRHPNLDI